MNELLNTLANKQIFSVSALNSAAKSLLESNFAQIWVEGEISNFSAPSSGHWYFSLKDDRASIKCAMFRNKNQRLRFRPKQGDKFIARGQISLYTARGDYQLIVENLTDAGTGEQQRAFEALKLSLSNKGWFDLANKQTMPTAPKHIAVITSSTGAVWHDIQTVYKRRYPFAHLTLLAVSVQGTEAVNDICGAFKRLEKHEGTIDAVILARGGGANEDLAAFNDEAVATAIHRCDLPVVTGIGHETDITIADFVADRRAATPTAAAELLTPDIEDYKQRLTHLQSRLLKAQRRQIINRTQAFQVIQQRLKHPKTKLNERSQHLDNLTIRLQQANDKHIGNARIAGEQLRNRLYRCSPVKRIEQQQTQLHASNKSLHLAFKRHMNNKHASLANAAQQLNAVSPLATMSRGYSIVFDEQKQLVDSPKLVNKGDRLSIKTKEGDIDTQVL